MIRLAEKGLQHAVIRAEKTHVNISVAVAVEARMLRTVIERLARSEQSGKGPLLMIPILGETHVRGMTLPSGYYLQHPPQYIPPSPPFTPTRELASQVEAAPTAPTPPAIPYQAQIVPVGPPRPVEAARSGPPGGKLTVANVRKGPAILFEMAEDGKLNFLQKVSALEAVTVKPGGGKRFLAVFPDDLPGAETLDLSQAGAVWLLR